MKKFTLSSNFDRVLVQLAERTDLTLEQMKEIAAEVESLPDSSTKNSAIHRLADRIPRGADVDLQGQPLDPVTIASPLNSA